MNLIISNHTIHTSDNLYSLNDLHKSSGGEKRHEPNRFLRNQNTQNLIAEIESEGTVAYHTVQGKGKQQGTYACRELVYAYAMWISAKFHLMVIRAFDALNTEAIPCLTRTTPDDRRPLVNAVRMLVQRTHISYEYAYKMVNQYMGTTHIGQIPMGELSRAVEYVHSLMMQAHGVNVERDTQNAFWRAVGLIEYERLDDDIERISRAFDELSAQLALLKRKKGLIYDALAEQWIGSHVDKMACRERAAAFVQCQLGI